MKKTLILVTSLAFVGAGAYGQGTIVWSDNPAAAVTIQIYAPQTLTPTVETTGNSAVDNPSGTQTYTGVAIGGASGASGTPYNYTFGNNFTAQLFALGSTSTLTGPAATLANMTTVLLPVTQYTSAFYSTKPAAAGWFLPVSPSPDAGISGTGTGSTASATLSVAAWYNGGNTITSLAAAEAAKVPYGWSVPWAETALGGTGSPPATPPGLTGFSSFSLISPTVSTVPEPCTMVLGLLGAAGFLIRRRK